MEHKWLVRVIMRELKLSLKENIVFKSLHADAFARYAACTSLSQVCAEFAVGGPGRAKARSGGLFGVVDIEAGAPFAPNLAWGASGECDQAARRAAKGCEILNFQGSVSSAQVPTQFQKLIWFGSPR